MILGRIISKFNIDASKLFEVSSHKEYIDKTTPTIIVGKKFAEEIYGKENVKILDRNIEKNVTWIYSKFEKRNEYETQLQEFICTQLHKLLKTVKYNYFNIFYEDIGRIKNLITFIKTDIFKTFYILDDKMVYFCVGENTFGLSLEDTKYIGIDNDKIFSLIKSNKNNYMINKEDAALLEDYRECIGNINYIVPYLFFYK